MKQPLNVLPTRLQAGGVDEDYEAVEFSPSGPQGNVIEDLKSKLKT